MRRLLELALLLPTVALAAGTPTGPPPASTGDTIPTSVRTIWVDRASRNGACSDTSSNPFSQSQPLCHLPALWTNTAIGGLAPGDQINLVPGSSTTDTYGEVDTHLGALGTFNANASLNPSVKGTAVCAGGANVNWNCRSDADCPSSTCTYHPIVVKCQTVGGVQASISPGATGGVQATGGTVCNGGVPGRYIGINFDNPSCNNVSNEQTMCWGGSTWGKPCTTVSNCTGAVACAARPWNWIFDGCDISSWSDYDHRTTIGGNNYCSMDAIQMGPFHGCSNGDRGGQGVTFQNNYFHDNHGSGVLNALSGSAGIRFFHNKVLNNRTHGYTTMLNLFKLNDASIGSTTYAWGNWFAKNGDTSPPWCGTGQACYGTASLTCLDGASAGASCHTNVDCGDFQCGPECTLNPFGATNPLNQGYTCACNATTDCAAGLTCQTYTTGGGCTPTNTEGKNAGVDTAQTGSNLDFENNIVALAAGDGIICNSSDNCRIINNTFWHNGQKGGGSGQYGEIQLEGNNHTVENNLIVPDPTAMTCFEGGNGGQHCSTPNSGVGCPGGTVCVAPGMLMAETFNAWPVTPSTNVADYDEYWFNLSGFSSDPPLFPPTSFNLAASWNTLSQYKTRPNTREPHGFAADPQFLSTTVTADPANAGGFLHLATASPAGGAGNHAVAPSFDYNGVARPNPPGVGALEPDSGGVTTTTTTSTTTTTGAGTTTTTTTLPSGHFRIRDGQQLGVIWR